MNEFLTVVFYLLSAVFAVFSCITVFGVSKPRIKNIISAQYSASLGGNNFLSTVLVYAVVRGSVLFGSSARLLWVAVGLFSSQYFLFWWLLFVITVCWFLGLSLRGNKKFDRVLTSKNLVFSDPVSLHWVSVACSLLSLPVYIMIPINRFLIGWYP